MFLKRPLNVLRYNMYTVYVWWDFLLFRNGPIYPYPSELLNWHLGNLLLNHLPLDKMIAISQTTFTSKFSWMKIYELCLRFHEICSEGSNWWWSRIVSDNGLVPTRRQAIIWISDVLGYRRINASLGLNELAKYLIHCCLVTAGS